tara:strand:- start:2721 stop:3527 length:807 start_codon:yes stop_codon:yes gene_type:complete
MKQYRDGVDFVVIVFYRYEYAQLLVESIKKYVKGIDYTVHIINNGKNKGDGNGYDILCDLFENEPNVKIHKGVDQDPDSNSVHVNDYICKIDGRGVAIGSYTQTQAMDIGVRAGDRKYICFQDADTIYLNEFIHELLPLLEDNFFVSHKWEPGIEIAKDQCMFIKRESVENNYLYEKDDLYPNIHYKDTCGTLTLYAKEKELPYVILKNSFNDRSLTHEHRLNLKNGEQSYINDRPFVYHFGRGSVRQDDLYHQWMKEASKYLGVAWK